MDRAVGADDDAVSSDQGPGDGAEKGGVGAETGGPEVEEGAAAAAAAELQGGGKKRKGRQGKQQEASKEQRAAWRVIGEEELGALHKALGRLDAWFAGERCFCFGGEGEGKVLVHTCRRVSAGIRARLHACTR